MRKEKLKKNQVQIYKTKQTLVEKHFKSKYIILAILFKSKIVVRIVKLGHKFFFYFNFPFALFSIFRTRVSV